jgi:hypothetical protein
VVLITWVQLTSPGIFHNLILSKKTK